MDDFDLRQKFVVEINQPATTLQPQAKIQVQIDRTFWGNL